MYATTRIAATPVRMLRNHKIVATMNIRDMKFFKKIQIKSNQTKKSIYPALTFGYFLLEMQWTLSQIFIEFEMGSG